MGNKVDRGDPREMLRKWQEAEAQHAAAEAAAAERKRRAAELRRTKRRRRVERFSAPDDELLQSNVGPDDGGDGRAGTSSQHHGAHCGAGGLQPPCLSNAQHRLRLAVPPVPPATGDVVAMQGPPDFALAWGSTAAATGQQTLDPAAQQALDNLRAWIASGMPNDM